MKNENYLTTENLMLISKELDTEFNINDLDLNDLSSQNLNFSNTVNEFVGKFKSVLDKYIEQLKIEGGAILDDLIIKVISIYNYNLQILRDKGKEFIEIIELLIQRYIEKIYEFLVKTIPYEINSPNAIFQLDSLSFERTYGMKAGFKAQVTELFKIVVDANIKIKTHYIIKK